MPHPRWLTPDEQQAWRAFLSATQHLFGAIDAQLQRDAGLSHGDYEILVRLSEAPQRRLRMAELAASVLFSRSRLSHAAGRLERVGWVCREPDPRDGRGTVAVLTDAGYELLAAAAAGHVETVRRQLFDRLSREQVDALHQLSAALAQGGPEVGPEGSPGVTVVDAGSPGPAQGASTRTDATSGRSWDERPTSRA